MALGSGQGSVPFQSNCCRLFFSFLWQQKPKCLLDVLEPPPHPPPLQRCFRWITMPLVAFSGVQLNVSRVMWLWKGLWLWTQLNILSWWRKKNETWISTGLGGALDNRLEFDLGVIDDHHCFSVFFILNKLITIFSTWLSWSLQCEDGRSSGVGPSLGWTGCHPPVVQREDQRDDHDADH